MNNETDTSYLAERFSAVFKNQITRDEAVSNEEVNQEANEQNCCVIYLHGDLGAGKTTFSRYLIQALGHTGSVKSPTYTLVEPYLLSWGAVYHLDLYRLSDPQELDFIGISDIFSQAKLCLIEWPSKGEGFLQQADIELNCQLVDEQETARRFEIIALTKAGENILLALQST